VGEAITTDMGLQSLEGARDESPDGGAKRRQIMEGARTVFLADGFDGASMNDIARVAGVSKGTLYVYFKSKEELFVAIVEDAKLQQAERLFTFDPGEDIETALKRLGRGFVRLMCTPQHIASVRIVTAIANRLPELGARFYNNGPAMGISRLKAYLESQVAAGVLEAHDCETAAAQLIDATMSRTFKPLMFNAAGMPDEALIDYVVGEAVGTYLRAWRRRSAAGRP
jgi:AcrR family transcriptional regulator